MASKFKLRKGSVRVCFPPFFRPGFFLGQNKVKLGVFLFFCLSFKLKERKGEIL